MSSNILLVWDNKAEDIAFFVIPTKLIDLRLIDVLIESHREAINDSDASENALCLYYAVSADKAYNVPEKGAEPANWNPAWSGCLAKFKQDSSTGITVEPVTRIVYSGFAF